MLTSPEQLEQDLRALNDLVVNCPELAELEALVGDFNIFQVLRSEDSELRHSNILAWLLDPAESHGLDALFLQKWLMRVIHGGTTRAEVSPVDIDSWDLVQVEVRREWQNIDVLLILTMIGGEQWVICIENKVESKQHSNQLARYRDLVEAHFADAARRVYVFLTKNPEIPEDTAYIPARYTQVHQALSEAVANRRLSIGQEPRVLIDNYLRLLEEKFMNESEVAKTVLKIYQRHQRAIDVIIGHQDSIQELISSRLDSLLRQKCDDLGIIVEPAAKRIVRFIPVSWNQEGNQHGTEPSGSNSQILFELGFWSKPPKLTIVAYKPPEEWIEHIRNQWRSNSFDGSQSYPKLYSEDLKIQLDLATISSPEESADELFDWLSHRLQEDDMMDTISAVSEALPVLHEIQSRQSASQ